MAHSLSPECTPLKLEYDSCFNAWFEGYLEPAVAASSSEQRSSYSKQKADEFQQKCEKCGRAIESVFRQRCVRTDTKLGIQA